MCSYHGWQFDEQGTCTKVPQAENPQLVANQQKNLCAIAFYRKSSSTLPYLQIF
jgi:phenylpropionate dioxygenase-like ring-hydroxylating dioxygenase large terminal subunit